MCVLYSSFALSIVLRLPASSVCILAKRDLHRGKRDLTTIEAKETYYRGKRDLL
jgi:hypothetical protein